MNKENSSGAGKGNGMEQSLNAVICALNSQYIHSSLAPWCLLAGVNAFCEAGITARVTEGTINENIEDVVQRITDQNPQAVGFCCYIWNITAAKRLIRLVKSRLPDTVVILGGPEVSYHAEAVLREEPLVSYVISGEGEKPFALLLNAINSGKGTENIPGVCYRGSDGIVVSEPYTPEEEPPTPYTPDYFNALKGRIAYLETSRGCPYSCAFCLSGRCGNVRFFNLERAKREMLLLANSGTQTVKLVDRTFNANRKRSNELFRFIIEHYGTEIPNGVCFHFELAGDLLDDETIRLLSAAPVGAMQLEIGLQSFYGKTLEAVHRKTDMERLKRNIARLISNANMHIHIDLIAGLPYEDLNRFAQSFNTAYSLRPNMLQLGFLKLLYGAPMREQSKEFPCSYSPEPPYEVTETPWLSQRELQLLHRTEDALERLSNSGRFRRTLEYVFRQSGLPPFELFRGFGEYASEKGTERISLDDYTALAYEYFSGLEGVEKTALRDALVCDRLATNSTGRLPAVLRVPDPSLKDVVRQLESGEETRGKKGIKRGAALLYSERCAVYADYIGRNPVTGEYPLVKIPLEPLNEKNQAIHERAKIE
jgi:Fe-S oxidoreductase